MAFQGRRSVHTAVGRSRDPGVRWRQPTPELASLEPRVPDKRFPSWLSPVGAFLVGAVGVALLLVATNGSDTDEGSAALAQAFTDGYTSGLEEAVVTQSSSATQKEVPPPVAPASERVVEAGPLRLGLPPVEEMGLYTRLAFESLLSQRWENPLQVLRMLQSRGTLAPSPWVGLPVSQGH